MRKAAYLIIFLISISRSTIAQIEKFSEKLIKNAQDLKSDINAFYLEQLNKKWAIKNANISINHIYLLKPSKEFTSTINSFKDYSFLKHLENSTIKIKKDELIDSWSLINANGRYFDATNGNIYQYENQEVFKNRIELFKVAKKHDIFFLFIIYEKSSKFIFGLSESSITVFDSQKDRLTVYTLEEFVNCCWDEFNLSD